MSFLTSDIYEGSDGHLFLAHGSNDVASLFSNNNPERQPLLERWTNLVLERSERLCACGIDYFHCFIPDKLTIYREEAGDLWGGLSSLAEEFESVFVQMGNNSIIPLVPYLRKQKKDYLLYLKNDTHWTPKGCFSAYQMICSLLKLEPNNDAIFRPTNQIRLPGDLGGKLNPPRYDACEYGAFGKGAVQIYANDIVSLRQNGTIENDVSLHVGSIVSFSCKDAKNDVKLLIFGDSYSEYRKHYLTGLLSETVREITFVWSSGIDYRIIEQQKPDIVVSETAERFMARLPDDTIDIAEHARNKLIKHMQSRAGHSQNG